MRLIYPLLLIAFLVAASLGGAAQSAERNQHGFYIPQNLAEANEQLDRTLTPAAQAKFRGLTERELPNISGIFLLNEWDETPNGRPSRFNRYLNAHLRITSDTWDFFEEEERRYLIYLSYWRHLHQQPFDVAAEAGKLVARRDSLAREAELTRQRNLLADSIDGVYIPRDLPECFAQLDRLLPDSVQQQLRQPDAAAAFHMSLGQWMRNYWGLWGGSRLQQYFEHQGIRHPDHMSGLVLHGYADYLAGQAPNPAQLARYQQFEADIQAMPPPSAPPPLTKPQRRNYSRPYRRFLRTHRIPDFDCKSPEDYAE